MDVLASIARAAREFLPAGAQGILRRKVGSIKCVQFSLCKLLICLQFVLTGKRGNHGRRQRVVDGDPSHGISGTTDSETDEDAHVSEEDDSHERHAEAAPAKRLRRRPAAAS